MATPPQPSRCARITTITISTSIATMSITITITLITITRITTITFLARPPGHLDVPVLAGDVERPRRLVRGHAPRVEHPPL